LSFAEAVAHTKHILTEATRKSGYDIEVTVEEPTDPSYGDLTTTVTLELANRLHKNPKDVAEQIARRIDFGTHPYIRSVRQVSGYLNFTFEPLKYSAAVFEGISRKGGDYGKPEDVKTKRVLVEHTNSNPNKALHIGTLRNTVLGDCLARVLRYVGHSVRVLNYIDDSGAQVADNLVAHLYMGHPMEPKGERFDVYAGRIYAEVQSAIESDEELAKKKSEIISKIEQGNNETASTARSFAERVASDQLRTCWSANVFFDLLNWESDIVKSGLFEESISSLEKHGRISRPQDGRNKGAVTIRLSDVEVFSKLEEPDEVLIRSDGTATYVGKDIAYAWWKVGEPSIDFKYRTFVIQPNGQTLWTTDHAKGGKAPERYNGADLAITVVDSRQEYPQAVVREALGFLSQHAKESYQPFLYEVVALSGETAYQLSKDESFKSKKIVHMSGRKGLVVNAEDVLAELGKRAKSESSKRNPSAREEWLDLVGSEIAVGSIRYALAKTDLKNLMVFDIEEALRLDGDTGQRLQYTHARAYGILLKAGPYEQGPLLPQLLKSEPEITLVKEMAKLSHWVKVAAQDLQPKYLTQYAKQLADEFNIFYETCPVLSAEPPDLRSSRLHLTEAFVIVFGKVLDLLGIPALKEM
jgi:arginyl-tRNA synthetase